MSKKKRSPKPIPGETGPPLSDKQSETLRRRIAKKRKELDAKGIKPQGLGSLGRARDEHRLLGGSTEGQSRFPSIKGVSKPKPGPKPDDPSEEYNTEIPMLWINPLTNAEAALVARLEEGFAEAREEIRQEIGGITLKVDIEATAVILAHAIASIFNSISASGVTKERATQFYEQYVTLISARAEEIYGQGGT